MTVEAEPEDDDQDADNRSRMTERARMRKVPLREEKSPISSMDEAGETRGARAVKSSPMKGKQRRQRASTPTGIRGRRKSVTDLDITVLGDDDGDKPTKKRRKPRGRKGTDKETDIEEDSPKKLNMSSENRGRGRPKAKISNTAFEIAEDEDRQDYTERDQSQINGSHDSASGLRELDLNRVALRSKSAHELKVNHSESAPSGPCDISRIYSSTRQVSTSTNYPTPEPSAEDEDSAKEEPLHPDPTDHHEEFDTIMESEGFTMISLDTLSSARHNSDIHNIGSQTPLSLHPSSTTRSGQSATRRSALPIPIPSHLRSDNDYSEISSTVPTPPSSLSLAIAATPHPLVHNQSSPTLPSPPKPPSASTSLAKPTPPRLSRVVRAGIALQGVLSPTTQAASLARQSAQKRQSALRSPLAPVPPKTETKVAGANGARERLDDLFGGFDSGLRRELRAGLRFGEELARRMEGSKGLQDREQIVTYPRLEHADRRTPNMDSAPFSSSPEPAGANRRTSNPVVGLVQQEQHWERERQIISRQIQDAAPENVITIESDDDNDDNGESVAAPGSTDHQTNLADNDHSSERIMEADDGEHENDIWLSEADRSNASFRSSPPSLPYQQQRPQPQPQNQDLAPRRRSAIPSPWKRGEDLDRSSVINATAGMDETSGLFWMQQEKLRPKAKRDSMLSMGLRRDQEGKFDIKEIMQRRTSSLEDGLESSRVRGGEIIEDEDEGGSGYGGELDGSDGDLEELNNEGEGEREEVTEDTTNLMLDNLEPTETRSASQVPAQPTPTPVHSSNLTSPCSSSLLSSAPSHPQKIPVNFNDSSSLLTTTTTTTAKTSEAPSPAASSSPHSHPFTNDTSPPTPTSSGPCTPILKKTGSALELRSRSVEKGKKEKRRVSFSPVVSTRCFEVVSPNDSGNSGEDDEVRQFADGRVGRNEDEDEGDTIEVDEGGDREVVPEEKLRTQSTQPLPTQASAASGGGSWLGRLSSWFNAPSSASATSITSKKATNDTASTCRADFEPVDFTDDHHRYLLSLYLQSIGLTPPPSISNSTSALNPTGSKSESTAPRPSIATLVNRAQYRITKPSSQPPERRQEEKTKAKEVITWTLDAPSAHVLEKWFQAVEKVEGVEKWKGREREVGKRLFSLRVGVEERSQLK